MGLVVVQRAVARLDLDVRKAIKQFFDYGLDDRVSAARKKWLQEAQAALTRGEP